MRYCGEGIIKAMWVDEAAGAVINLGNYVEVQILDLARMVLELTGSGSKIEFHPLPIDDPRRRCPDVSKARKLLGWEPKTCLELGLLRTTRWFHGHIS